MLIQLGYVSTATAVMQRADLIRLLRTSRDLNQRNGVTGLLLYHGGHFMQVIEGEEGAVRETFGRILRDSRHRDIAVLFEEPIGARFFADWTMGFQQLDGSELLEFPDADGQPGDLRSMTHDIGGAKKLMLVMRSRGLDPAKDVVTS